jgi:hypothetical protein
MTAPLRVVGPVLEPPPPQAEIRAAVANVSAVNGILRYEYFMLLLPDFSKKCRCCFSMKLPT